MCVCVGGGGSNYFALHSTELLTAVAFIRSSTKSTIAVTHSSTNRNALRENEQSFYQRHNKNGFYSTAVEVINIHSPLYFSPSSLDSALKLLYTAYRVDPTKEPMLWRSGVIPLRLQNSVFAGFSGRQASRSPIQVLTAMHYFVRKPTTPPT